MSQKKEKMMRRQQAQAPEFDPKIAQIVQTVFTGEEAVAPIVGPYTSTLQMLNSWVVSGLPFQGEMAEMEKARISPFMYRALLLGFTVGILLGKEE